MKREKIDKKKEAAKIRSKKTKNLTANKRIKERDPDLWKEVYSGLKLLAKKYKNFRNKQSIKKQKEEQRRLKEQEEQRLQEQEEQKLQEQEERRLQKEQRLKEEEERRFKAREEEIRLKEQEEQRLQEQEQQKLQEQEERRLEERQESKEEGKRLNGKVKWFNGARGYGFIEREGEEKDIFVHFFAVKKSGLKHLEKDELLTFEIENSEKGPSATNLQKVINLQQAPIPFLKLVKKN